MYLKCSDRMEDSVSSNEIVPTDLKEQFGLGLHFLCRLISLKTLGKSSIFYKKKIRKKKQEAHGPRFVHLSDIATADMQMLCNIFPILSSQLMKISSFEQFLVLKENIWA